MGEIVGAGLLAHVPTIMLPEQTRRELNGGEDFSLVPGLERLRREVFDTLAMAEAAPKRETWVTAIDDPYLPVFYATVNLWHYLGRGLPDKRWISVSVCQTGDTEDFLRAGRALGDAIAATDRKVILVASGALSHTFWPLRELRKHESGSLDSIRTPQARDADLERIAWFEAGDHRRVLDTMPDFLRYRPEAKFSHYLQMIGALGESAVTAPGRRYGEYENSIGTGQVHLWFDRPAVGWTAPR
jgi:3,4-dihydroxyphenylacetate 2,3-dioxygenase